MKGMAVVQSHVSSSICTRNVKKRWQWALLERGRNIVMAPCSTISRVPPITATAQMAYTFALPSRRQLVCLNRTLISWWWWDITLEHCKLQLSLFMIYNEFFIDRFNNNMWPKKKQTTTHHNPDTFLANTQSPFTPMQIKRTTCPVLTLHRKQLQGETMGLWRQASFGGGRVQWPELRKMFTKSKIHLRYTRKPPSHHQCRVQLPGEQSQRKYHPLFLQHEKVCCEYKSTTSSW